MRAHSTSTSAGITGQEVAVIRITELSLPLDYTPESAAQGHRQAPEDPRRRPARFHRLQAQLRRAQEEQRHHVRLHRRSDGAQRGGGAASAWRSDPPGAARARHHLPPGGDRRRRRSRERPLVVGFGPCGLFAALLLAQTGFKPIVLERGRDVRRRTQDTWALWRKNTLTPESNVQFGEGGAGLFSDGKLYSQIKDPKFYGRKVMHEFVRAGRAGRDPVRQQAAHRHVPAHRRGGSDARGDHRARRRGALREQGDRPADRERPDRRRACSRAARRSRSRHVVLALGHSARDTFRMLRARGVFIEPKPFALGFRIEHPQSLIDRARLGKYAGHPELGAADYKLVHHAQQWPRGVQLLHVSGRHRGGRDLRARARGDQRHEPVLAQRAQCQRGHRRRHQSGSGFPGRAAGRRGTAGAAGIAGLRAGRQRLLRAGATGRRLHSRRAVHRSSAKSSPRTSPACGSAICRRRCRPTRSRRSAKRCRRSAGRSAASTATTPCSPASRRARPRRCASRAMPRHCRA